MSRAQNLLSQLGDARLWSGAVAPAIAARPSGAEALDALLPGGGWPVGALTEILYDTAGIGELSLVLPHLARVTQAGGRAALAAPPHLPYAPALVQAGVVLPRVLMVRPAGDGSLWAAEQMLRSGVFGTVLLWPGNLSERELRRLQLAAETGQSIAFLFRNRRAISQSSPAALRLELCRSAEGLEVNVLKCRGGQPARLRLAA